MNHLSCRFCQARLTQTFVDLGLSPVANDYIPFSKMEASEAFYPLHVYICTKCWLVQLPIYKTEGEIFTNHYAYFSSYSSSWLEHAKKYAEMMLKRFGFDKTKLVIEIASNDGYLLQYFKEKGICVLGVEPAKNTADVARKKGIPTVTKFFGENTAKELAKKGKRADLLIGNNVLGHVPNLNDFVAGMKIVLKPKGIMTIEFPYLLQLIQKNQFDTIYHEHYSYFSFLTVKKVFAKHGLTLFDVEEIPTHGGSLRIYGRHSENKDIQVTKSVDALIRKEIVFGLHRFETYKQFSEKVKKTKQLFLKFLIEVKKRGQTVVGYGAPAKGNTFLNYCGVRTDFIEYTVDLSPHKQKHFLPGVRIPIYAPDKITKTHPDYVLILPWNIKNEVIDQMRSVRRWGGKFVTAIPKVTIS